MAQLVPVRVLIPFLYIRSALIAPIKFFQGGARESLRELYRTLQMYFSNRLLAAHLLVQQNQVEVRQAAWYQKSLATFSYAIGWVFWSTEADVTFSQVNQKDHMVKTSPAFFLCLIDTVCYTA